MDRKIAIIGLGYVGLPVATAFGKIGEVVGFDINEARIEELKQGIDSTGEVSTEELQSSNVIYTTNIEDAELCDFYIVAVPTPLGDTNIPDLNPLIDASVDISIYLAKGDIVVYESTVYPGVTEDECVPRLEALSSLKCGDDFKVGYSPERINPGDKEHSFTNITKIVSGCDEETTEIIGDVYSSVVTAGVYLASSIKVAEAAKVIENTQRDLNIALMNELAVIFNNMDIDTNEVLDAACTKWNFLNFRPGLVGGHCIGIDPYYLTHKSQLLGYNPQVILAGRRINNSMAKFISEQTIKQLIKHGKDVSRSNVLILGATFKEDCPDLRNSKVIDIIYELEDYGIGVQIYDPVADPAEVEAVFSKTPAEAINLNQVDAVIHAVPHKEFKDFGVRWLSDVKKSNTVLIDIKNTFDRDTLEGLGLNFWRL